jgi:hypothetical protein
MHPDNVEAIINKMVSLSKSAFFIWQFFLSVWRREDETADVLTRQMDYN